MKLLQFFIVVVLLTPLYLFAADETPKPNGAEVQQQQTQATPKKEAATDVAQPQAGETSSPATEATPAEAQNPNLAPAEPTADQATPAQPQPTTADFKSFTNTSDNAKEFVKSMLDSIYAELPNKTSNQEIFAFLAEVTNNYFAFTYMSTWTIGREVIKDVSAEDQQRFLDLSKEFMVLLYGEIFNTYYNQYTYTLGEVEKKSDTQYDVRMIVEPKVKDAKNQDTILNIVWKVKYSTQENRFYIINVDVNGVLLLMSQQKQFRDMLKSQNNDFGKFLELLNTKNMESKSRLGVVL
ncbi:MAG: ABC transporter substrate-binding protein [Alphaproteobacteria bacterium]|jgi:ABC-type transporter MlaC component|nr:ABC transporter substrate-binding protein [Alphaproteobacteria bacterium]